jgi:hypothetical protein
MYIYIGMQEAEITAAAGAAMDMAEDAFSTLVPGPEELLMGDKDVRMYI